ncbi:MAG: hypothetical protein DRN53_03660 [Thermoprotei archaeon]|nr:MAG: hypothetical protein DRN53_03660 [Thermoprotei archaeon]
MGSSIIPHSSSSIFTTQKVFILTSLVIHHENMPHKIVKFIEGIPLRITTTPTGKVLQVKMKTSRGDLTVSSETATSGTCILKDKRTRSTSEVKIESLRRRLTRSEYRALQYAVDLVLKST